MLNNKGRAIAFPLMIALWVYSCSNGDQDYSKLKKDPVSTKAAIINEKFYLPNSPVSHDFFYYYQYKVGNQLFKGNGADAHYKVCDSILIIY